ncbi:glycosyltransferase [Nonomuraea sp. NN258]|uniref:glycosyltransferase n=1 Tax=Nonomuraea antri TaxID=2730852 RepID=UPI00156837E7|nr:glycosyltransferase [Nonomuraea antri]NRQ32320.1 glycosyltransferase [Nonomuraea antri]
MSQPVFHGGKRPIVALVTDAIHPYSFGGREMRYHELGPHLAPYADVHVFTMRWWDGPRVRTEGGITFHAISRLLPMYRQGVRSVWQALTFAAACLRLLRHRFDVLNVDQIPFLHLLPLRLVATLRRKPLVATWHEVWGPEYWRESMGGRWRPAWWIERLAMRAPDRIIAVSPQTAMRLRAELGERARITIAPNGIDLAQVEQASPDERRTDLVVVSRLMRHKGLDLLLAAVARLHATGRAVSCRIIGDGPERDALHREAERLGIAHAVEFRHDVSEQKDVYALVKAARVFAFPSTREGFGIAVLEAIACGVPVVTTSARDNLAQHLVLRTRRGIVCDHHLDAFAAALARALDAPDGDEPERESWVGEYALESIAAHVVKAMLP